jgi:5'(3')-deoxyribonucleotidase
MNESRLKIGIDVDNTINNLGERLIFFLNMSYGKNVRHDSLKSYCLQEAYPDLTLEQIFNPLTLKSFWDSIELDPEGLNLIKYLCEKCDAEIYLITAQVEEGFGYKLEWMREHIPDKYVPFKNYIFCSKKELINVDWLIDDHIENLIDFNGTKILLNKSYNKYIDVPEDIIRIDSLTEIIETIENDFKRPA